MRQAYQIGLTIVKFQSECNPLIDNALRGLARANCSGDLLPPSPPAEKATARQDQAGQVRNRRWDRERWAIRVAAR
jgi:hypothetical protein